MKNMDKSFFTGNREKVYDRLQGGVLVVPGYTQMQRGNDAAFAFEQEGNMWYLSGIEYPDWWLLMDSNRRKSWLVSPSVDERHQVFDGSLTAERASSISGVDDVIDRTEADNWLRAAAKNHQLVHSVGPPVGHEHFDFTLNPAAKDMHARLSRIFSTVDDFRGELAKERAIKQDVEIAMIQAAVDLTISGFERVYKNLHSYKYEYEVEADFTHEFRRAGASGHAYDPIVGIGDNACTLHYTHNDSRLKKGKLLLLDVGAKYGGYAADITRTYALGRATKRQQEVHAAVQEAQAEIINMIEPGMPFDKYIIKTDEFVLAAMKKLKLADGKHDPNFRKYYPHSIGHGLGIDTHDALGRPKVLEPGMVMTVEPGIYIPEEGIGVRIEDDILITDTGHRNMSARLSTDL